MNPTAHWIFGWCVRVCPQVGIAIALLATQASGQGAKEANLSGDWILTFTSPNGDKVESFLKLVQEGEKVTGVATAANGTKSPLEEGRIGDGEVFFTINRMLNGRNTTAKYVGQWTGDIIKGEFESNARGQVRTVPFEAVREKEPVGATGNWRWSFIRDDGERADFTLRLKEDEASGLSGVSVSPSGLEIAISDAVSKGDEISFSVVRERDGQKLTTTFRGRREGDLIKGKVQVDWTGETQTHDWEARRVRRRR